MWFRLRIENQEMLKTFEFFIENVSKEIKRTKNENFELESLFSRYIALKIYFVTDEKIYFSLISPKKKKLIFIKNLITIKLCI